MQTGTVSSTASTSTSSASTAPSQTLDKNAFLKLLVAQLQNQDPSSAQDPNQMVAQMTSYAQLEQAQNTNSYLSALQTQNAGIFQAQASSLVGKKVAVTTPNFTLKSGSASVGVNLGGDAATLTLTVKDSSGKTVATLNEGQQAAGSHLYTWNGADSSGKQLADGTYTVTATAKDSSGKDVTATTTSKVTVDSVVFANGSVLVMAGGQSFTLDKVNEISN